MSKLLNRVELEKALNEIPLNKLDIDSGIYEFYENKEMSLEFHTNIMKMEIKYIFLMCLYVGNISMCMENIKLFMTEFQNY